MRPRPFAFLLAALSSTACVSHAPLEQQVPHVAYQAAGPVVVSVNDQRHWLQEGKDGTFIGRAHGSFGIPVDLAVYPYYGQDKKNKQQTLASALEERIVLGLSSDGWAASAPPAPAPLTAELIRETLANSEGARLLVLTLREWFVSLNLNWVTAFNFDWDVEIKVFAADGSSVKHAAKGRDVVDVAYNESYPNHIRFAYRERLARLLEEPAVRAALQGSAAAPTESAPASEP